MNSPVKLDKMFVASVLLWTRLDVPSGGLVGFAAGVHAEARRKLRKRTGGNGGLRNPDGL